MGENIVDEQKPQGLREHVQHLPRRLQTQPADSFIMFSCIPSQLSYLVLETQQDQSLSDLQKTRL